MAHEIRHDMHETDIGSGVKTPGQQDVERDIARINTPADQQAQQSQQSHTQAAQAVQGTVGGAPRDGSHLQQGVAEQRRVWEKQDPAEMTQEVPGLDAAPAGRVLQSGDHLARIAAVPQTDGSYEAQVYVRLTREPELAETYIPAGTYPDQTQAWAAAEERAKRALNEHEF